MMPVYAVATTEGIQIYHEETEQATILQNTMNNNLSHHIQELSIPTKLLLAHVKLPNDDGCELYEAFLQQQVFFASDGSVVQGSGSYGFIITNETRTLVMECYGRVPYTSMDDISQRAEFYGALVVVLAIQI